MYGDTANKLVLDAKRACGLSEVPLYQGELVRSIVKEVSDLQADAEFLQSKVQDEAELLDGEQEKIKQCQLFVTHLNMRRNKRCLLGYHKSRAEKIDEFSWLNVEPILSSSTAKSNQDIAQVTMANSKEVGNYTNYTTQLALENLSHTEQEYYKSYEDIITNYKSHFADIDLSGDIHPPTNIFIDVRVLKNGGEIQTEYGIFNLIKDSQFFVRKSDVERLIQQGYLEEI